MCVYLRESRRTNRDGSVVRYLQLAHNERHPQTGNPVAKVLHSFGRVEQVDRAALARLVSSISRFLTPEEAAAAASGMEVEVVDSRRLGGTWTLDRVCERLGIGAAIRKAADGRRLDGAAFERVVFALVAQRALEPGSKLAGTKWAAERVAIEGCEGFTDDAAYAAMDFLLDALDDIAGEVFASVAHLLNLDLDIAFVDTASTCELKSAGLKHLPSGHFMANAAWLAPAAMTHNPRPSRRPAHRPRPTPGDRRHAAPQGLHHARPAGPHRPATTPTTTRSLAVGPGDHHRPAPHPHDPAALLTTRPVPTTRTLDKPEGWRPRHAPGPVRRPTHASLLHLHEQQHQRWIRAQCRAAGHQARSCFRRSRSTDSRAPRACSHRSRRPRIDNTERTGEQRTNCDRPSHRQPQLDRRRRRRTGLQSPQHGQRTGQRHLQQTAAAPRAAEQTRPTSRSLRRRLAPSQTWVGRPGHSSDGVLPRGRRGCRALAARVLLGRRRRLAKSPGASRCM